MSTATMEQAITIRPHAKICTPPEFKTRIKLSSILQNEEVQKFFASSKIEPVPRVIRAPREKVQSTERADRFDVIMATHWHKNEPLTPIPEGKVQHLGRAAQLQDIGIPAIGKEYFFTDKEEFLYDMMRALYDLNDFEGDLLTGRYVNYTYEPVAVITDYQGVIADNRSYSTDSSLIKTVMDDTNDSINAIIRTRSPMNYIGIIFRSKSCEYESYEHFVRNTSRNTPDIKYVRYSLLI